MFLVFSIFAAICFTGGSALMKSSEGLTKFWPSAACLACFVAGAALQAMAMRGNPMGSTHIFGVGLEVALALMFGALFFSGASHFPQDWSGDLDLGGDDSPPEDRLVRFKLILPKSSRTQGGECGEIGRKAGRLLTGSRQRGVV